MTGPANGVMGDYPDPIEIPETTVNPEVLVEERKLAKYSKTAEFKRLKEFMDARVSFYQRYLPSGAQVEGTPSDGYKVNLSKDIPPDQLGSYWVAACIVIKEFENVLNEYANAAEAVSASEQG